MPKKKRKKSCNNNFFYNFTKDKSTINDRKFIVFR